ncbi:hypothetical protein COL154_001392 [Colletotrichum chrysophilum]|nr:hypothetical protein KNSL1_000361 [Colletotrichum chrysophilum]KAJ0370260.1 hypothetical protein COL154_001392 [Colletotrichum chrysophilum]
MASEEQGSDPIGIFLDGQQLDPTSSGRNTGYRYVNLYIDDFIELGEFCKFDDSAVHEQYFNRLFHHVHNIFNDDIVKHTRVINYVNGTHHLH